MTLVGKIFTVLILIMSVAFMMLAVTVFATHRNWRDMVVRPESEASAETPVGLKFQIEQLDQTNKQLREEIERAKDRLAIEQAARRFALAALQGRLETLDQELAQSRRAYQDLQAAHGVAVETVDRNQVIVEKLTEEVEGLRDEIRAAQQERDEKFAQVIQLTDQLNSLESTRQTLDERNKDLLAQNARFKKVMDKYELTEFTDVDGIPPRVDGYVIAIGEKDLAEISIGSDDGLRKGHTLEVYRGNSYVGRVKVVSTEPDRSVVTIIPAFRQATIQKGDRVATKLS